MRLAQLYAERLRERPAPARWEALASAIEDGVGEGTLQAGERLPTHRELAAVLGVTVRTVSRAYSETARRGLTVGTAGRGTFVVTPTRDVDICGDTGEIFVDGNGTPAEGSVAFSASHPVDLGFISPFEYLNPDLGDAVRKLAQQPDLNMLGGYQPPRGLLRHRQAGAVWASRYGLPIAADNVLVCAGAQHALLTVLASLFNPGDRIAAEQLSYPLLKQLAQRLRLNLTPIRMDRSGILPDSLEAACRAGAIRGLYLMPTCHNPTLAMLPEYRRRELVDICRRYDIVIIEDDVYALSVEQRLPPLSQLAPERSCFIASTSEAFCAGLRIAYLCASEAFQERLERTISYTVSMAPPLMAELAAMWIGDGTADSVLAAKRRAAAASSALARRVLDGFPLETRTTSFFCWLRLPLPPGEAQSFAEAARQWGIIVADSLHFALTAQPGEQGVRIALGLRDQRALKKALKVLASLLQRGGLC